MKSHVILVDRILASWPSICMCQQDRSASPAPSPLTPSYHISIATVEGGRGGEVGFAFFEVT